MIDFRGFDNNRGLDVSRGYNPDALSPDQMMAGAANVNQQGAAIRMTSATPTMQQRIKALGVATPIVLSSPVRRYVLTSLTRNILFHREQIDRNFKIFIKEEISLKILFFPIIFLLFYYFRQRKKKFFIRFNSISFMIIIQN